MFKSNGNSIYLVLLLVLSSSFSHELVVFASSSEDKSFRRHDPLNHFKLYNGSYDITNKHYWASAAFTGIHGYAFAGLWLLLGIGVGGYIAIKNFNDGFSSTFLSRTHSSVYIVMFSLVVLFTLLSIIACCFVLLEDQNCFQRVKKLKGTIFGALGDASQAMRRVINALVVMQSLLRPYDTSTCNLLNVTSHKIRRESLQIQQFVQQSKQPVDEAAKVLYFTNLAVVSFNLLMLVAALVFAMLHWYPGILVSILCLWIITTLSWILTGFDYFFHTFAVDTCSALGESEQNPKNSSLPFIHVCSTSQDSSKFLIQIGYTIHTFISQLNLKLMELQEVLAINEDKAFRVGEICDPFAEAPTYSYTPGNCAKSSIPIGDLPKLLSRFGCHKVENSRTYCVGVGTFLPEGSYEMAEAYSESIQKLLDVFPDLLSLIECSMVKNAFSDIVVSQCKPLKKSARGLWSSTLALSITMVVLVFIWIAKAFLDRQKSFSMFSLVPKGL